MMHLGGDFFENLKEAYGERKDMYVISDRNASIIKAVSDVYYEMSSILWQNHI
ncbi:hypothetical protein P3S67_010251 [Capsicum chacoense]